MCCAMQHSQKETGEALTAEIIAGAKLDFKLLWNWGFLESFAAKQSSSQLGCTGGFSGCPLLHDWDNKIHPEILNATRDWRDLEPSF